MSTTLPPNCVLKDLRRRGYRVLDWEPVGEDKWLGYDPVLKAACTVALVTSKACVEVLKREAYFEVETP